MVVAVTDGQLIARCRRGDQGAWVALVERYERLVFSIAINRGLSGDDANDVTQATFSVLLESLDRIEDPTRLGAWLTTVAKRQSIRVIERLSRERQRDRSIPEPVQLPSPAEERVLDDVEWLHQGLNQLSERCQQVLTALYFSAMSYEEAAASLGVPLGSLGPTRARCLATLRRELERIDNND